MQRRHRNPTPKSTVGRKAQKTLSKTDALPVSLTPFIDKNQSKTNDHVRQMLSALLAGHKINQNKASGKRCKQMKLLTAAAPSSATNSTDCATAEEAHSSLKLRGDQSLNIDLPST